MKVASMIALASAALLMSTVSGSNNATQPDAIDPLIVGGTIVPIGTKTYIVGLRLTANGRGFCGGSLIGPKHVLTAAHCATNREINYVAIGTHYLSGASDGEQIRVIKRSPHPSYREASTGFDYMVLELERASKYPPVTLGTKLDIVPDTTVTTLGWGQISQTGKQSPVLLSVDLQLRTNADCTRLLRGYYSAGTMVCAGGEKGKGACFGDSGGPLVTSKNGVDVLIGVASWLVFCAQSSDNEPVVYARVPSVLGWIEKVMTATPAPTKPPATDRCQGMSEQMCNELQCNWSDGYCASY